MCVHLCFQSTVDAAGRGMGKTEEEKARIEVISKGKAYQLLSKIENFIEKNGKKDGCVIGDKMTLADVALFASTSFISSGWFNGIPKDCMEQFPKIQAVRKAVASHPAVQARYFNNTSKNPMYKVYADCKNL